MSKNRATNYILPEEILKANKDSAKSLLRFANNTLQELKMDGWKMEWEIIDSFGMCVKDLKFFTIPTWVLNQQLWCQREYVLHEIAHGLCDDIKHGEAFYSQFSNLLIAFMRGDSKR